MARKENMTELNSEFGVFTLNETSVGRGGNNRKRSDVQLIQFFLMQFYFEHLEFFDGRIPKTKLGGPLIKIDGICGRQTEMGILHFQKFQSQGGAPITVDAQVNVAKTFFSQINGNPFTILHLNSWFRRFGNGKQFHGNLENHPDIIALLQNCKQSLPQLKSVTR